MRGSLTIVFATGAAALLAACPADEAPIDPPPPACGSIDDGNACTTDTCTDTGAVYTPVEAGTACGGGAVCDGDGACVACIDDTGCSGNRVCNTTTNTCVACTEDADCGAGSLCLEAENVCAPMTCVDGEQNETETGVDCGGACGPCADGVGCQVAADCASEVCEGDVCQVPSCGDGVVHDGEACDDGGNAAGNGCAADCQLEDGFDCDGSPSVCRRVFMLHVGGTDTGAFAVVETRTGRQGEGEAVLFCNDPTCRVALPPALGGYRVTYRNAPEAPFFEGCRAERRGGEKCYFTDPLAEITIDPEPRDLVVDAVGVTVQVFDGRTGAPIQTIVDDMQTIVDAPRDCYLAFSGAASYEVTGCPRMPQKEASWRGEACGAGGGDTVRVAATSDESQITVNQTGEVGTIEMVDRESREVLGSCATATCVLSYQDAPRGVRLRAYSDSGLGAAWQGCDLVRSRRLGRSSGAVECYVRHPGATISVDFPSRPFTVRHVAGTGSGTTTVRSHSAQRVAPVIWACPSTSQACTDASPVAGLQETFAIWKDEPIRVVAEPAPGSRATYVSGCLGQREGHCLTSDDLVSEVVVRYDINNDE